MSLHILGKVEPSMETDIGSFAKMIRDGYQAQIDVLDKENTQFKEIIDEMQRGLGRIVGGIKKENWRSVSGVREII